MSDTTYFLAQDGTRIAVVTPWDTHGSGIIPPPAIEFNRAGGPWQFAYDGHLPRAEGGNDE